jgi:putative ABC transport system permease protein
MAATPEDVSKVASTVDDMFRNSPQPTKTESEKAFGLSFVNMLGNVKAFILSICVAVVFTTLLVSANTMAMSIRERTREVAVLKTLGFQRGTILGLFVGEAMSLSVIGGLFGCSFAWMLLTVMKNSPMGFFLAQMTISGGTLVVAILVAALVGFLSSVIPSYNAASVEIVEGLRHIG